jgi:hypothetical protein
MAQGRREGTSLCERIGALMDKASEAHVTSGAGTDITMSTMGALERTRHWLIAETKLLRKLSLNKALILVVVLTAKLTS